jgi:hypothetical protein
MTKPTEEKSLDWHEEECRATFDRKQKIMSMFSDNAKTYIQLSGAALALTLTFAHEILRIPKDQKVADVWMILMWSCFLLAIISGAFYQYRAVKLLETEIGSRTIGGRNWSPESFTVSCWPRSMGEQSFLRAMPSSGCGEDEAQ